MGSVLRSRVYYGYQHSGVLDKKVAILGYKRYGFVHLMHSRFDHGWLWANLATIT